MIAISPLADVALSHDTRVTAGSDSGHVAALSAEGAASLISPDFKTVKTFTIPEDPEAAALSPDGSLLAVAAAEGITILATSTFEKSHRLNDAFLSCLFVGEKLFWTCARFTEQTVTLEAWEPGSWTKIARVKVADPYGNSTFFLFAHPNRNSVVLFAGAGQDGQCLFWAILEGTEISVSRFEALDEAGLPSFSPSGEEFLVTSECELHCYTYPQDLLKGRLTELDGDEEDPIGFFVSYVDADHAVVTSMNGRLFLVDVAEMSVINEVAVPNLRPSDDLNYFLQLPDRKFVLVYRESGGSHRNSCLHLLAPKEA
jgi:WD40 repeat protein